MAKFLHNTGSLEALGIKARYLWKLQERVADLIERPTGSLAGAAAFHHQHAK